MGVHTAMNVCERMHFELPSCEGFEPNFFCLSAFFYASSKVQLWLALVRSSFSLFLLIFSVGKWQQGCDADAVSDRDRLFERS